MTLYTFVGCFIPSLGLKHWQFLTPQKKNEYDLKHLPSDDINIYGQGYLSIWKGHFKGFKDSIVMNIHSYKELQHFKLKIPFPNTLKSVNVKISKTWNALMTWLERWISNNSSYCKDRCFQETLIEIVGLPLFFLVWLGAFPGSCLLSSTRDQWHFSQRSLPNLISYPREHVRP